MSVFWLSTAASLVATVVLMIQVAHRRHAGTASPDDTLDMTLFANAWSWAAAMTSIAGRVLLGHLLPETWRASFDSAAAGTSTALMGAIAGGSWAWAALIMFRTWLRGYRTGNGSHEQRIEAAGRAVLPKPPAANTAEEEKREQKARLHAMSIMAMGSVLGVTTATATTLAVSTGQTALQQTLSVLAEHAAVIIGALSAALWLHLGTGSKTGNRNDGGRPGGTPQAPAGTG